MAASGPDIVEALKNIQVCTTDDDFIRAVGSVPASALDDAAGDLLLVLTIREGDGTQSWPAENLRSVTERCLGLLESDLSVTTIAETCASGLALTAAALARGDAASDGDRSWAFSVLERVGEDLNVVTVEIFRGIVRLEEEIEDAEDEDALTFSYWTALELSQTWRRLAVWIFAVLAALAKPRRLQAEDLWEWAGRDALAIFVLVRALLTYDSWSEGFVSVGLPQDLLTLQQSVLEAALSLQLPSVAFAGEENMVYTESNDVSMSERHEALARHRANLREAFSESGLLFACLRFLAPEAIASRCTVGLRLAGFLAAVAPHGLELISHSTGEKLWQALGLSCTACCLELDSANRQNPLALLRRHLDACRELAVVVRPGPIQLDNLLSKALQVCQWSGAYDAGVIAGAAALAACVGSPNECGFELKQAFAHLPPEEASSVSVLLSRRLACLTAPLERVQLSAWKELLPEPPISAEAAVGPSDIITVASIGTAAATSSSIAPGESGGLRGLIAEAPPRFRCALDGKLLADPVRSPQGDVFERSTLQRRLVQNGGLCPRTGAPLSLSDCPRAPDVRRDLLAWVRSNPTAVSAARRANR